MRSAAMASLIAAGLLSGCSAKVAAHTDSAPKTFTARGTVTMPLEFEGDASTDDVQYCLNAFAGVTQTQVPILNAAQKPVGYGVMEAPTFNENLGACVAHWTAKDLPETDGVYSYQIGTSKPILFSEKDASNLRVHFPDTGAGNQPSDPY